MEKVYHRKMSLFHLQVLMLFTLFFIIHINFFAKKKRKIWIQLGWLYLDTIETIKLFCKEDEIIFINKPSDLKAISYTF